MNKKKLYTMAGGLALVAAIGVGSTLAYFTDQDEANNVVELGLVDIVLTETEWSGDKQNVTPGQTYAKNPTVTVKEGSNPAYVRILVDYEITSPEGVTRDLTTDEIADIENRLEIDRNFWDKGIDGYWYYQEVLGAGSSATLFNEITIPDQWGNEYRNHTLNVKITAQAIQSENVEDIIVPGEPITSWGNVEIESLNND